MRSCCPPDTGWYWCVFRIHFRMCVVELKLAHAVSCRQASIVGSKVTLYCVIIINVGVCGMLVRVRVVLRKIRCYMLRKVISFYVPFHTHTHTHTHTHAHTHTCTHAHTQGLGIFTFKNNLNHTLSNFLLYVDYNKSFAYFLCNIIIVSCVHACTFLCTFGLLLTVFLASFVCYLILQVSIKLLLLLLQ